MIRFQRFEKYEIPTTDRKVAAARRAIERKKVKAAKQYPLFPELQIITETAESRIQRYKAAGDRYTKRIRRETAQNWIRGRRILRSLPENIQSEILEQWNNGHHPRTSSYFLGKLWDSLANQHRICFDCQKKVFGHKRSPEEYTLCDGKLWSWWIGLNDWRQISAEKAKQSICELCGAKFFHYTVKRWKEKSFEQLDLLEAVCTK